MKKVRLFVLAALLCGTLAGCSDTDTEYIINVSYDATRTFYNTYNEMFINHWKDLTGEDIDVVQSHGGSGKQALEVANGLEADVVTLALEADVSAIADAGLLEDDFVSQFPYDSSPYTSIIVFMVRKDNPKEIYDWDDLLRSDVGVITPNPQTSGGARWNYLAAWYYFETQGQNEEEIIESMTMLYGNVLVLDSGARASATSFIENGQGDVLIAWENEAFQALDEYPGQYEIVIPSVSIICQPTVALISEIAEKHGTTDIATEYLMYLYSDEAQELEVQNYFRPVNEDIKECYESVSSSHTIKEIPEDGKWIVNDVDLTGIESFGGWSEASKKHFDDGGYFDRIFE